MTSIAILAFLTAAVGPSADLRPLALGDQGWVQCYEPNDQEKTCRSIATYWKNSDGSWDNIAVVQLAPSRPFTLETVTKVSEENGAVCGTIRLKDVLNGKLRQAGKQIPKHNAVPILRKIAEGMASLIDKRICTQFEPVPAGLIARSTIEGGNSAFPDQRVKWVSDSEGYRIEAGAPL